MIYNFNELTNRLNNLKFNEFLKDWKVNDIESDCATKTQTQIINDKKVEVITKESTIIGKCYSKTISTDNGWDTNKCKFYCYNNGKTRLSITNYNRDGFDTYESDTLITNPQEFINEFEAIFNKKFHWVDIEKYINDLKNRL